VRGHARIMQKGEKHDSQQYLKNEPRLRERQVCKVRSGAAAEKGFIPFIFLIIAHVSVCHKGGTLQKKRFEAEKTKKKRRGKREEHLLRERVKGVPNPTRSWIRQKNPGIHQKDPARDRKSHDIEFDKKEGNRDLVLEKNR